MTPMTPIFRPSSSVGRPPVVGTILATPDGRRYALVRCAFSLGEDAGGNGSPRVECWVGLAEADYGTLIVRGVGRKGTPLDWTAIDGWHEISEIRHPEVAEAIRLATKDWPTLPSLSGPIDDQPTTILDRRVILPDDDRFPKDMPAIRQSLRDLITRRNTCPDDEVWAIDCVILNLAPREPRHA